MIDPATVAESIIFREAVTFALVYRKDDEDFRAMAEARKSLKLRLIKELKQAADHARHDQPALLKKVHDFLERQIFDDVDEADKLRMEVIEAIKKAEREEKS